MKDEDASRELFSGSSRITGIRGLDLDEEVRAFDEVQLIDFAIAPRIEPDIEHLHQVAFCLHAS